MREKLGLPCVQGDFLQVALPERSYDAVTLWYVLEHFRDAAAALTRANRLLRPGGVLAFSTPSASGISARRSLHRFLSASPADHFTIWAPRLAGPLLRRFGFRLKRLRVTGHHPERFPGRLPAGTLLAASRLLGLGDTFEAYAVKIGEPVMNVLILGGGTMQLPAARIARRKGWKVFVAAKSIDPAVRALADEALEVDLQDREGLVAVAQDLRARHGLHGVFTAGTDFSTTVAWVAEKLRLPGIPYAVALNATDKSRMRARFRAKRVPCPRFYTVEEGPEGPHAQKSRRKASSSPWWSSRWTTWAHGGCAASTGEEDYAAAVDLALEQSRSRRVIVEEYMDGPELSLDAVVYRGQATVCGVADRHIFFPPYFVEMGHTMPSDLDPELLRQAEEVFLAGHPGPGDPQRRGQGRHQADRLRARRSGRSPPAFPAGTCPAGPSPCPAGWR